MRIQYDFTGKATRTYDVTIVLSHGEYEHRTAAPSKEVAILKATHAMISTYNRPGDPTVKAVRVELYKQ